MSQPKPVKIMICGGGTGGHIFPAIAIANRLHRMHQPNIDILFVGAKNHMEMVKVPRAGYKIRGLWISGWYRGFALRNFVFPLKLLFSLIKSFFMIRQYRPDVVIGVGGYSSGPPVFVASLMNIPTLIQEQNSYAGMTNRILGKFVDTICISYEAAKKYFPAPNTTTTGNPVRQSILQVPELKKGSQEKQQQCYDHFRLDPQKKTLLVMGGSLGARTINEAIKQKIDLLKQENNIQVLWQCGQLYIHEMKRFVDYIDVPHVHPQEFINRMDYAYTIADVIVSRAGAIAIAELCVAAAPTILVPSPNVAEDHQTKNAMALVEKTAAEMITDQKAIPRLVPQVLALLKDRPRQQTLSQNLQQLAVYNADEQIAHQVNLLINA